MEKEQTLYLTAWGYNSARLFQRLEKIALDNGGAIVSTWEKELTTYHIIPRYDDRVDEEKAITTNYRSYINFYLDGFVYYIQLDSNPFFPHYFQKIPVNKDLQNKYKYYLEELKTSDFLYDCLFGFDCSDNEIKEIANLIYNQVLNFKGYKKATTRRRRYVSGYGNGANKHHYIYENIPDEEPTYKRQYHVIKD